MPKHHVKTVKTRRPSCPPKHTKTKPGSRAWVKYMAAARACKRPSGKRHARVSKTSGKTVCFKARGKRVCFKRKQK